MGNYRFYNRVIAIAICFLTFSSLHSQSVPTSGLVAWYPFNGNANDGSINGNNGTVNGATLTTDRKGNANSAYYVSGISCQPHILSTVNTTTINTSGKVTFAFWIYREGDGCASPRVFQFGDGSKENDANGGHFVLGWANGEKRIFIEHASAGINHRDYNWGSDLDDRSWYHIAYTFNGATAKLYINGQLINTRSTSGSAKLEQQFSMGRFNKPSYDAFNGKLDDVGIWNRALSDAEILGLFKPGPQLSNIESGNKKNTLLWTSTTDTAVKKYKIYRSTSTIPDNSLITELATVSDVSVNSLIDSSLLTNGVNYYYRMKWVFAGSTGDSVGSFGNELTGTPNLVATPTNFSINKEGGSVRLNWDLVAESGVQYQIYRGTSPTTKTFLDSLSTNTYLDNSIAGSTVYYYWIRTLSTNGAFSDFSDVLTMSAVPYVNQDSSRNGIVLLKLNQISNTAVNRLNIYKGTSVSPSIKYDSTILSRSYSDSANNIFNTILYYRITSIGSGLNESSYSNEIRTISFKPSTLLSPVNLAVKSDTICKFIWSKISNALSYKLQYSQDSLFVSNVNEQIVSDTSYTKVGLAENKNYYWRVQTQDTVHYSSWSNFNRFQTFLIPPIISAVKAGNKVDTISWSIKNTSNVKYFKIYRDTTNNPVKLLDSISKDIRSYIDTSKLILNLKYYYRIVVGNTNNIESDFSNSIYGIPFNTKPISLKLQSKTFANSGEYNLIKTSFTASGSKDLDGSIVDYKWYINDSLMNKKDSLFNYFYPQGTTQVKLVLTDNDGDKDSSSTFVNITSFQKTFQGGILGGITALSANSIFTADTTFDPINGASISKLDRSGNTTLQLIVGSKIFTTPSVSTDSSIFITSGSTLNGFNKSGVPLWSTIPLGGLTKVTPTIDSLFNRIYVGVSNKNFFAIDYKTGKVVWSYFCDAPINTSAVITGDRKLVFISQNGTLYGFDIRSDSVLTNAKWQYQLGETVSKSGAADLNHNLYFGTNAGNLIKLKLNADGKVEKLWSVSLTDSVECSPVIDANGNLYVGTNAGKFYKIDPTNGTIKWVYSTKGAITATPVISDYGSIIFATKSGNLISLDSNKQVLWQYNDNSPISANILYINNMVYVGNESGKYFAIYDNPTTSSINTSLSVSPDFKMLSSFSSAKSMAGSYQIPMSHDLEYSLLKYKNTQIPYYLIEPVPVVTKPIWGTFQGNYRRSGAQITECPSVPTIKLPNCAETMDTIKVSTNSMVNRYWIINDTVNKILKDSIITIKKSDKISLSTYNAYGCVINNSILDTIPNSFIVKPIITSASVTNSVCDGDSLKLSVSNSNKNYWNSTSGTIKNVEANSFIVKKQDSYQVLSVNTYGCKSSSDKFNFTVFSIPGIPLISRDSAGNLVSSASVGNRWYKEGALITDTLLKFKPSTPGNYSLKSIVNGCTSAMSTTYYYLVTNILELSSNEFLKLTPNPFTNYLNFDFSIKGLQKLNIDVFELASGTKVASRNGLYPGTRINLASIAGGIYLVKVSSDDGKVAYQFKMIKL